MSSAFSRYFQREKVAVGRMRAKCMIKRNSGEALAFVLTHFWSVSISIQSTARCQALFSCILLLFSCLALYSHISY
jgi:hypothetical protein